MAQLLIPVVASFAINALSSLLTPTVTQTNEGSRLNDLAIPKSEFGTPIRDIYGRQRINACPMIWALPLKEEREEQTSRAGKGQPSVKTTEFSYYLSATFLIGSEINSVRRVWANGELIYNSSGIVSNELDGAFADHCQIRLGIEDQTLPEVIATNEDLPESGLRPQLKGISTLSFDRYPVGLLNSQGFPRIDIEVVGKFGLNPTVGSIILDACKKALIPESDVVFVGDAAADTITGITFGNDGQTWGEFIEDICKVRFLIAYESGGKIYFRRAGDTEIKGLIRMDSVAARNAASPAPKPYEKSVLDPLALPSSLQLSFSNSEKNFDSSNIAVYSPTATHKNETNVSTRVAINDSTATSWCSKTYYQILNNSHQIKLSLLPCWNGLKVGDSIVLLENRKNRAYRITKKTLGNNYLIEVEANGANFSYESDYQSGDGTGGVVVPGKSLTVAPSVTTSYPSPPSQVTGTATIIPLDIPLLNDLDADNTLYLAVSGDANWSGGAIYRSGDGGASYDYIRAAGKKSVIGTVATPILSTATSLTVVTEGGVISSVTQAKYNAFQGILFKLGNEIIMARDATKTSANTYVLGGQLRRGCRGTEWAIEGHGVNEQFILLTEGIYSIEGTTLDIGTLFRLKAVGNGGIEPMVTAYSSITPTGVNLECYSPAAVTGVKDQAGNILFTVTRRDRRAGFRTDYAAFPLSETQLSLEIDVMNGATVVRTLSGLTKTIAYPVAQQIDDFGAVQSAVSVRAYQLSAIVGRGYPLAVTVTPAAQAIAPTISTFSPTQGAIGSTLKIFGSGFIGSTVVEIGSTAVSSFTVDNDGQITATVAAGTVSSKVRVTNPGGTQLSVGEFTIVSLSEGGGRVSLTQSLLMTANQTQQVVFDIAKSFVLIRVATSSPAWVRFYGSSSAQAADGSRDNNTDPIEGSGVMAELTTVLGALTVNFSPPALVVSDSETVPITVTNNSGTPLTLDLTYTFLGIE